MFAPEQILCQAPAVLETRAKCPADNKLSKRVGYRTGNEAAHLIKQPATNEAINQSLQRNIEFLMALILCKDDPVSYHGKRKMKASKTLC